MCKCFVQYESQGITRFNSYGFLLDTERQDFVGVLGFMKGRRTTYVTRLLAMTRLLTSPCCDYLEIERTISWL